MNWTVYFCPAGYPTIGYGQVVRNDEDFAADIDETKAEELLRQDAQIAERAVLFLINVPLTDSQFDALVISNPKLLEIPLQHFKQMKLVNTFCWLDEYTQAFA
ncbi:lysozyme [bacterium]|nr:lysozyme [bacterium]